MTHSRPSSIIKVHGVREIAHISLITIDYNIVVGNGSVEKDVMNDVNGGHAQEGW